MWRCVDIIYITSITTSYQFQLFRDRLSPMYLENNKKWVLSLLVSLLAVTFFIGLVMKLSDTKRVIQERNKGGEIK